MGKYCGTLIWIVGILRAGTARLGARGILVEARGAYRTGLAYFKHTFLALMSIYIHINVTLIIPKKLLLVSYIVLPA